MAAQKAAPSFLHDADAHLDERLLLLRQLHNWEGYGLFWGLIEKMRVADEYRLRQDAIPTIAYALIVKPQKLADVVHSAIEIGAFESDGTYFWAPSLLRRMDAYQKRCEKNRENSLLGVAARHRSPNGQPIGNRPLSERSARGQRSVTLTRNTNTNKKGGVGENNPRLTDRSPSADQTVTKPVPVGDLLGQVNSKIAEAKKERSR